LEKIESLQDAILLEIVAAKYQLNALTVVVALAIRRMLSVDNVWNTLNQLCKHNVLADDSCGKVFLNYSCYHSRNNYLIKLNNLYVFVATYLLDFFFEM
jgi:hypothetical protein